LSTKGATCGVPWVLEKVLPASPFNTLRIFGESDRALVIAPKRVAVSTWPNEIVKWHESFGHLTIVAAVGTSSQRI
jgi:hypothetical protein